MSSLFMEWNFVNLKRLRFNHEGFHQTCHTMDFPIFMPLFTSDLFQLKKRKPLCVAVCTQAAVLYSTQLPSLLSKIKNRLQQINTSHINFNTNSSIQQRIHGFTLSSIFSRCTNKMKWCNTRESAARQTKKSNALTHDALKEAPGRIGHGDAEKKVTLLTRSNFRN